jgi:cytochrome c-type biogenesis protein CcmH/NrfG
MPDETLTVFSGPAALEAVRGEPPMTRRDVVTLVAISVLVLGLNLWYYSQRASENWVWERAIQLHNRGCEAFDREEFEEAAELFQQSVQCWPAYVDGWQDLALANMSLKRVGEARAAIDRLKQLGFDARQLEEDFQHRFSLPAPIPKLSLPPPPGLEK